MKRTIALIPLLLLFACSEKDPADPTSPLEPIMPSLLTSMYNSPLIDHEVAAIDPYELNFTIEQRTDGQYTMVTTIDLHGGSFFVSPHSVGDFKGKFFIELGDDKNLLLGPEFIETPRSIEVFDPHRFVNGPVNWVSTDTRYEYPLTLNTTKDFDVGGKIIFTIEPKCTLEEIPFMITYRNGVIKIENWNC